MSTPKVHFKTICLYMQQHQYDTLLVLERTRTSIVNLIYALSKEENIYIKNVFCIFNNHEKLSP